MKKALLFITLAIAAVACQEKEKVEVADSLDLASDMITFTCEGGAQNVSITANNAWNATVTSGADWLSASGSSTLDITAAATKSHKGRMGSVVVVAGSVKKVISICQTPAPNLDKIEIDPTDLAFDPIGGTKEITVKANVPVTAVSSDSWLSIEGPADNTASVMTFKLSASAYSLPAVRRSTVTFSGGDAKDVELLVLQTPAEFIALSVESIDVPAVGDTYSVHVTSNCNWTATSSETWASVTPDSGMESDLTVSVSANGTTSDRTANITLAYGSTKAVLVVSQKGKDGPKVLATWNYTLSNDEYLKVHNPDWDYNNPNVNTNWILVAEDNVNTAHWIATYPSDAPAYTPRSAISSGIAFNGMWTGDGLEYSVANVSAEAGQKLCFYTGIMIGNKQTPATWDVKFSIDDGATWIDGETTLYDKNGTVISKITTQTVKTQHEIESHITLSKNLSKASIKVFIYAKDGTIGVNGTARTTSAHTIRFSPVKIIATYVGGTVVLD